MTGDPYEEADEQQRLAEAKLVTPTPAKKSRKVVFAGMVLAGTILAVVILANIAGLVTGKMTPDAHSAPKPTTMTHQQSDSFAQQQSGQAAYMKGMDRDKTLQNNEDTVLGQSGNLAADAYAEADGVPRKTKAQDDAEHVRDRSSQSGAKSETQQQRKRAALEEQHRRQSDLDSSPLALDFSDYFEKEKQPAPSSVATNQEATPAPTSQDGAPDRSARRRHSAFADVLGSDGEQAETETASSRRQAHDPNGDYAFDSSFGKLYRVMEDTVIETVLANRLTGAAVGPVITMVTTDVYSENGSHLLIPKGTRLLGSVSAVGSVNQERLFVAFHRMIMPDGYSVSLDKFQGLDVVGQTGLRDQVNHHYVQIFGTSLALAAISATTQIGNNASYGTYDWGTQMRNGVSEGLGQSAQRVMERFLNVLPTFTIRERARVKVMLAGDLLLPDIKNHTMDPDL
ncbi:MAG TPA: TrbI/VirB10 family protein [Bryobacteraceae bacterium]|nr:TrbI/VirB10 family protein [Bryobacteraceae bacterium]